MASAFVLREHGDRGGGGGLGGVTGVGRGVFVRVTGASGPVVAGQVFAQKVQVQRLAAGTAFGHGSGEAADGRAAPRHDPNGRETVHHRAAGDQVRRRVGPRSDMV